MEKNKIEKDKTGKIEKYFKNYLWKNIFVSMLFLFLGVLLVFNPSMSAMIIAYVIGIILIANGIASMLYISPKMTFYDSTLIGIISLILGIVILISPDVFTTIIPVLLGIWFIIVGVIKYRLSIILNELGIKGWGATVATAILIIFSGIFLILCPKIGSISLVVALGTFIILYSLSNIADFFILKKKVKDLAKYFN